MSRFHARRPEQEPSSRPRASAELARARACSQALHLSGHMRITQLCAGCADEPVRKDSLAEQALLQGSWKGKFSKMSCYGD